MGVFRGILRGLMEVLGVLRKIQRELEGCQVDFREFQEISGGLMSI